MKKLHLVMAVSALALFASAPSMASDLVIKIKNGTKSVLTKVYVSPVGVDDWEEDVLGTDVLGPGETLRITLGGGRKVCNFDMKFEFSEDSNLDTTTDTQNLCKLETYTLTE